MNNCCTLFPPKDCFIRPGQSQLLLYKHCNDLVRRIFLSCVNSAATLRPDLLNIYVQKINLQFGQIYSKPKMGKSPSCIHAQV